MITRFLTSVQATFNPFSAAHKTPRIFLSMLPPGLRGPGGTTIKTTILPRASRDKSSLVLQFKDGTQMDLDMGKYRIKDVIAEVDRHSRALQRQEELTGS